VQEWLVKHYELILEVCRSITPHYEDLAHDIIIKLSDTEQPTPDSELRYWIYRTSRNHYLNLQKRERSVELTHDPKQTEDEPTKDPYDYILQIKNSSLNDIEKLWLMTYLDCGGSYEEVSRKINVCRQTVAKKVKQAISKL